MMKDRKQQQFSHPMTPFRPNLIKQCATSTISQSPKPLNPPSSIDARIIKTGFDPDTYRANFHLKLLLTQGNLSHARHLFDQMPHPNHFSLNLMISSYVNSGTLSKARELLDTMVERSNAVTWTILIGGYSRGGQFSEAFKVYVEMHRWGTKPDYVTFATLLSGCSNVDATRELVQVHSHVVKMGYHSTLMVCNALVDSYCKSDCMDFGFRLFKEMPVRDAVTFNALITRYSRAGLNEGAIWLFAEMQNLGYRPSEFTFAAVLCAGISLDDIVFGEQVHGFVVKANFVWNVFVGNALLDFYSKHDYVVEARKLFDEMPVLDCVSYNILISSYVWHGKFTEALDLFHELQFTKNDRKQLPFATILSIAANTMNINVGRKIHSQAVVATADSEAQVGNSLVDMYGKCGRFNEARRVFVSLADRSTVPWTAIISAYVQRGLHEEGLELYNEMHRGNISPDQATFASILRASASLALLSLGKQLHSSVIRLGFICNVFPASALLDMYAKCGYMKDALQTFQEMPKRNIVCWNALISAYAQNGDGKGTLRSFEWMVQSGFAPDAITFLSVLTACSHCGLVEEGMCYFNSLMHNSNIVPKREHYASMVDVLCRSGRFDEAEKLMAQMPFEPDEVMWSSVLNSCRIHKNQQLAERAANRLFNMTELRDAAAYVNMSNIYAETGEWESLREVKKAMRERGVRKVTACSWVEIKQKIHVFKVNDISHPESRKILSKIDELAKKNGKGRIQG